MRSASSHNELVRFLRSVVGSGEIVTIAYADGSKPGRDREVVPLACSHRELVAVEPSSAIRKRFKINKILWVRTSDGQRIENDEAQEQFAGQPPEFDTLGGYADHYRSQFEASGWYVHESDASLGVGGFFQNGKPKNTPSVLISCFDRSTETVFDFKSGDFVEVQKTRTGRERPWRVDCWRFKEGRSFGSLSPAIRLFLEEVQASRPDSAKGMYAGH